jgi:hypothetical protein
MGVSNGVFGNIQKGRTRLGDIFAHIHWNCTSSSKRLVFVESPERRFSGCSRAPRHPCRMRSVPRRCRAPQGLLGFVAGAEQSAPPISIAKVSPKYARKLSAIETLGRHNFGGLVGLEGL